MTKRLYKQLQRGASKFLRRQVRTKKARKRLLIAVVLMGVLSLGMVQKLTKPFSVDPTAYTPLLDLVAKGESGGNYNAYFGHPKNTEIRFTDMTIDEVLQWQSEYASKGSISNAVGKYQIIQPTLTEFVGKLGIDKNEKFDKPLQDQIAIALLERRGVVAFVGKKLSREQFAANLAMEWAALPRTIGPNPHESYYAADGINKSSVSVDEMNTVLGVLQDTVNVGP